MSWELLTVALLAGFANWVFRALPVLLHADRMAVGGALGRFLSATGPAAIGTLFVASILPSLTVDPATLIPVVAGVAGVLAVYLVSRSVVAATLAGAVLHGAVVWLIA